jgi:uncharacterized membrane protein YfcA
MTMNFTLSPRGWALAAFCGLLVGFSKTGMPGMGILPVPLLALIIPPRESSGVLLPMLIFGDVLAVAYYHRRAVWSHLLPLLPCTLVGIVAGYFALGRLDNRQVGPLIGAIILGLLALGWWRRRGAGANGDVTFRYPTLAAIAFGTLAGFTTMVANAAAPVMALYLLAMRLPKEEFLGTGAWFFLLVNWAKVPFSLRLHLITRESLRFNLMLAPLIVLGALAGIWLQKRIPQRAFDTIVQILAALAALRLFA